MFFFYAQVLQQNLGNIIYTLVLTPFLFYFNVHCKCVYESIEKNYTSDQVSQLRIAIF